MSTFITVDGECAMHGAWQRSWPANMTKVPPECPGCTKARHEAEDREHDRQRQVDLQELYLQSAIEEIGLAPRFKRCTLASFTAQSDEQHRVLRVCAEFVDSFEPQAGRNLFLIGDVGTGKTHLASAVARAIVERSAGRHRVRATTVAEYLRTIYTTWRPGSGITEQQVIDRFGTADLLVLDEIGVGASGEKQRDQLFALVDRRYQHQRPTIFISNLNVPAIELTLGPRLFDRMRDGALVLGCPWPSYRAFGRSAA